MKVKELFEQANSVMLEINYKMGTDQYAVLTTAHKGYFDETKLSGATGLVTKPIMIRNKNNRLWRDATFSDLTNPNNDDAEVKMGLMFIKHLEMIQEVWSKDAD